MERVKVIALHFGVWFAYISLAIIAYGYKKSNFSEYAYEIFFSYLQSALLFYSIVYIALEKYWRRRKFLVSVSMIILILALGISGRFLFAYVISPRLFKVSVSALSLAVDEQALTYFLQGTTFFIAAALYWYKTSKAELEKQLSLQIAQVAKKEKLELENAVLRAQINPHFIMNSLDAFRIQTLETDPLVSQGIFWFMKILRSGITTPEEDGKIKFKIELEAVQGTIYTFKSRFPSLQLEENIVVENIDEIRIVPHIVFPFVENAFKHGLYTDEKNKVSIALFASPNQIKVTVKNKKDTRIKDGSTGIGLQYVKRHLESGYQGKYNLIINETEELYLVDLSVQLN